MSGSSSILFPFFRWLLLLQFQQHLERYTGSDTRKRTAGRLVFALVLFQFASPILLAFGLLSRYCSLAWLVALSPFGPIEATTAMLLHQLCYHLKPKAASVTVSRKHPFYTAERSTHCSLRHYCDHYDCCSNGRYHHLVALAYIRQLCFELALINPNGAWLAIITLAMDLVAVRWKL